MNEAGKRLPEDKIAAGAWKMHRPPYAIAIWCGFLDQPENAFRPFFLPFDQHCAVRKLGAACANRSSDCMGIVVGTLLEPLDHITRKDIFRCGLHTGKDLRRFRKIGLRLETKVMKTANRQFRLLRTIQGNQNPSYPLIRSQRKTISLGGRGARKRGFFVGASPP